MIEVKLCQHHFLIESPNGPACRGRCKFCGEEREFRNSNEKFNWVQEKTFAYASNHPSDALGPLRIEKGYKE